MSRAVWCRECREGKHPNCDGTAWDVETDTMVLCQCPYAVHGSRPVNPPVLPTIPEVPAQAFSVAAGALDRPRGDSVDSPVLPYPSPDGPTSGFSGTDTSEERARRDDANGTTAARQTRTAALLLDAGFHGLTVKDLRERTGWHHGQASSVLSGLHKEGVIARLTERRDKCHVYVTVPEVHGRETQPHGRSRPRPKPMGEVEAAIDVMARVVMCSFYDHEYVYDRWDSFPEIGEHDWNAIVARIGELRASIIPTTETHEAAYNALKARATDEEIA